MNSSESNPQLKLAHDFIESTSQNLFLTGKAGTGKTTFLKNLCQISNKRMIVVAPTGVAAINAGGVTVHSFFQLPFGPQVPQNHAGGAGTDMQPEAENESRFTRLSREKKNIIRTLDLLIIDEISMVRADLLDAIDGVLRRHRNNHLPFGGVQLLMIGDLQQLAPVVKDDEWQLLGRYYDSPFFFSSKAIGEAGFISIELKHIYRQSDQHFIELLNKIRENKLDALSLEQINARYVPDFTPSDEDGYITLTTHNAQARAINDKKLAGVKSPEFEFTAEIKGDFPEYAYPTNEFLVLKKGAQVMFVKNDSSAEKLYYNGKIGRIVSIGDESIGIQCPGDPHVIYVEQAVWQNMKYSIDEETQEIKELPVGSFSQYPLKLAWAITIHKSQGLTFDKAVIDAQSAFAHGQVYVALSRCRTLEGLVLSTRISGRGIISNSNIESFTSEIENSNPDQELLRQAQVRYQLDLLTDLFDFSVLGRRINYCIKIASSNAGSLLGQPVKQLQDISRSVQEKLISVSQKFFVQIRQQDFSNQSVETNIALQGRIGKGCEYFLGILENEVIPAFNAVNFESDNKAVKKSLGTAQDQVDEQFIVKLATLHSGKESFNVSRILRARAKASIEKQVTRKTGKVEADFSPADIAYPEVFSKLKQWRNEKASEHSLPHYMILTQKAMAGLSQFLPSSQANLKRIKGIGKRTMEKFGDEILSIILAFREANGIDLKMPEAKSEKEKKDKKPTHEISFELFQAGKTLDEIAQKRGFAVTTIESHMAHYVGEGILDISRFVTEEKMELIASYFHRHDSLQLSEAKKALGESVSYSDLKYVLKYMQHTGQLS
jgi:hypothetical protein